MVKSIHTVVSDELALRVKTVKESHGWTWEEFLRNTAEMYEEMDECESDNE